MKPLSSTTPNLELFAAIVADRGLQIDSWRLEEALEMHLRFRPALDRMRAVALTPLPPYIQPVTAVRWIENGGKLL